MYEYCVLFYNARQANRRIRTTDKVQCVAIAGTAVALLFGTFAFSEYIAPIMDILLVLEVWYMLVLVYASSSQHSVLIQKLTPPGYHPVAHFSRRNTDSTKGAAQ